MTRTALYRHYDEGGQLLYVGITDCLSERDKQHRATAHWHGKVHRTETQWCLSREHAADLEKVAIRHEKPLHNVAHSVTNIRKPKIDATIGAKSFEWVAEIAGAVAKDGRSMRQISLAAGLGPNFVQQAISGRKQPGIENLRAIINECGHKNGAVS